MPKLTLCNYELCDYDEEPSFYAATCVFRIGNSNLDLEYRTACRMRARHNFGETAHMNTCKKLISRLCVYLGRPVQICTGDNAINVLCRMDVSVEVLILCLLIINRILMPSRMHTDKHETYRIQYDLHRNRFDREGVFESEYPYITQSYMLCIVLMCVVLYTCTDTDILMRMNAYSCIDLNCMHSAIIWLKCYKRLKAYFVFCL